MATVSQTSKPCFQCGQEIRFEKIGEKEDGKPIWRKLEKDGVTEHQCKKPATTTTGNSSGSNNKKNTELLESIDKSLNEILTEVKRQRMR